MKELGYDSPNSAAYVINQLVDQGYLRKKANGDLQLIKDIKATSEYAQTTKVPIVGSAPCGTPFLAEENIEGYISVSTAIAKSPYRHFLLHAIGDSMNKRNIHDGDLVLVRQQSTAQNGEVIVALIDDEATIKELHKSNDVIALLPQSTNLKHKPIILNRDFQIQGKIISVIPQSN